MDACRRRATQAAREGEHAHARHRPEEDGPRRTKDAVRGKAGKQNISLKPTNQSPYNRRKP
jgi:hypothetical protein